jgi:hypothetical protein
MMQGYLLRVTGQVRVRDILTAAGKQLTDLPTIAHIVEPESGRPRVCWAYILGRCVHPECSFKKFGGHPPSNEVPEAFIDATCEMLAPGVTALEAGEESPTKKPKVE